MQHTFSQNTEPPQGLGDCRQRLNAAGLLKNSISEMNMQIKLLYIREHDISKSLLIIEVNFPI